MAQVNFNDKQSGDQLTANDVNSLKSTINDNEGLLSNGTVSGYYDSNNQFRYNHHIIPESNGNFDLGNAEYKVRHLYLTSNSLWMGDDVKIDVSTDGTVQTKKRDKSKLPYYITGAAGLDATENQILDYFSKSNVSELTLSDLEKYAKTINSDATVSDIFPAEDSENYQESDFETKTSINQNKNQRKKIYIKYDYVALAPSIPTLDLNKHTDFEFIIDNASCTYYHENMEAPGLIKVNLKITEYNFNKFNVFIARPGDQNDDNGKLFTNGTQSIIRLGVVNQGGNFSYKLLDGMLQATMDLSAHNIIHFECVFAKGIDYLIPEMITFFNNDPNNTSGGYTNVYKMTLDGVDYYWLSSNSPTESQTIQEQTSIKSDANPGDYSLYTTTNNSEPLFFIASASDSSSITPSSEYTIASTQASLTWNGQNISNANIVESLEFGGVDLDILNGSLHTGYRYYGNDASYSSDR